MRRNVFAVRLPGLCLAAAATVTAPFATLAATVSTIKEFTNAHLGSGPGRLTRVGGKLYGTTQAGGTHGVGVVFWVTHSGRKKVVYSLDGSGSPLVESGGALYGFSFNGGTAQAGTVYALTPQGAYRTIYTFSGGADGLNPSSLIAIGGTLYGTTYAGGQYKHGTVFSLTPAGVETTLYAFQGHSDGASPTSLMADGATIYGTTSGGGVNGAGTVFSINSDGSESVLASFPFDKTAGSIPVGPLTKVGSELYGSTYIGGTGGYGTIFKISPTGHPKTLHSFDFADGQDPNGGLVVVGGVLYGTTVRGGAFESGTVFQITRQGALTTLHDFGSGQDDGTFPFAPLLNVGGTLYGTTGGIAKKNYGTVFTVVP